MTRNASSKRVATPVQESSALGDEPLLPEEPRCGNCKHYTGTYCALPLPPFIRTTDYAAHRVTAHTYRCGFHIWK